MTVVDSRFRTEAWSRTMHGLVAIKKRKSRKKTTMTRTSPRELQLELYCQAWLGGPQWATGRLGDLLSLYVQYTFRMRYQAGPPKLAHLALKLAFIRSHTRRSQKRDFGSYFPIRDCSGFETMSYVLIGSLAGNS